MLNKDNGKCLEGYDIHRIGNDCYDDEEEEDVARAGAESNGEWDATAQDVGGEPYGIEVEEVFANLVGAERQFFGPA